MKMKNAQQIKMKKLRSQKQTITHPLSNTTIANIGTNISSDSIATHA
jgi:hypothetical protein